MNFDDGFKSVLAFGIRLDEIVLEDADWKLIALSVLSFIFRLSYCEDCDLVSNSSLELLVERSNSPHTLDH